MNFLYEIVRQFYKLANTLQVLVQNFEQFKKTDFKDLSLHAHSYLKTVIIITVKLHSIVTFKGTAHLHDQSP